ncbi:MAG: hypothetical protein IPP19_00515 [Verrucomicrobia bacterium]|nr:hypothetical protein [Verrucomicrobiota bacterium]
MRACPALPRHLHRRTFTGVFWLHSFLALGFSLIALSVVVPRLITRDRASNALTIYLSRPLTSFDYLLGKLGIILGILVLMWTGPLLLGWLLSMAFAPDSDFFVYSFLPLSRALLFNLIALVTLAAVAMGVSALGKTARAVVPIWMAAWIVAGMIASLPTTPDVVRAASFSRNLEEVRQDIFRVDEILIKAGETLPLVDRGLTKNMLSLGQRESKRSATGAYIGLAAIVVVSSFVFSRKLRPE